MKNSPTGKFVISLDFELFWGVRDVSTIEKYGENILGARKAIPRILELFDAYDIHATFATVGFLFFDNKKDLLQGSPQLKPNYINEITSPYANILAEIKDNEEQDPYHFGLSLVKLIQQYPKNEIGTHTFSHYYCLEKGQTVEEFKADMIAAIDIAQQYGITLKSIVLPRNQFSGPYIKVCHELGITSFRGNEKVWFHAPQSLPDESLMKKIARFSDSFVNLSGHNCYSLDIIGREVPYNIPSSRFLRPYSDRLKYFEKLKLRRIFKSMEYAAKNGLVYHLWWHPHNFGVFLEENLNSLKNILEYYKQLEIKYNFQSTSMCEISDFLQKKSDNK
jgi:peptidoglycan/xylan/chitin deacetylase (PgdA/CDA1 family)